jgi:hypothetical protein
VKLNKDDSPTPGPTKRKVTPRKKGLLLGVGLDGKDGHVRLTTGRNFRLIGGSQETHEQMQEKAVKFNEELDRRGKQLEDLSRPELLDIAEKALR